MNTTSVTRKNIGTNGIYQTMPIKLETGIRVSRALREKIKRAAMFNHMTLVDYLDSIVPEIKMEEVK